MAEENQPRGERLLERSFARFEAIPALVEPRARRVEDEDRFVLEERDLDGEEGAVLGKSLETVGRLEPLDDRFFDDALTGGDARERGADGPPPDRNSRVSGKKLLPSDGARPLEESVEVRRGKRRELEQNPIGGAQPKVRPRESGLVALERKPAGSKRPARVPERFELPSDDGLEAEGRGGDERKRSVRFRSSSTSPTFPATRSCLRPSTSSYRTSGRSGR